MTSSPSNKVIALCLIWLLLLAPMGNVMAAVSALPAQDTHGMHVNADSRNHDDRVHHAAAPKTKHCLGGAGCAQMGGCALCVAGFHVLRLPERVSVASALSVTATHLIFSHDPDIDLRPPRA
jgi:hypothetical protein